MLSLNIKPKSLQGEELDALLSNGWFRAGQSVFTTAFLRFDSVYYNALWLKINLKEFEPSSEILRIQKRAQRFKTIIQPATITYEKERLFDQYKSIIGFNTSESLHQLLDSETSEDTIFNTYEVCVYDGVELIACGFFDIGNMNAAGINCFYHPNYKTYSLGKFIIYQKILYSKNLGFDFFYPGYFAPGYPRFNYKLSIAKTGNYFYQVSTRTWVSMLDFNEDVLPITKMKDKLEELSYELTKANIANRMLYYKHFDAMLYPSTRFLNFFEMPLFVELIDFSTESIYCLCYYNFISEEFKVIQSNSVYELLEMENSDTEFVKYVLNIESEICSSAIIQEVVELINLEIS